MVAGTNRQRTIVASMKTATVRPMPSSSMLPICAPPKHANTVILLVGAFVAIFGACLAVQAAGARMIFGMAQDQQLPLARRTAHVSKALVWPTAGIGLFALLLLAINITSTQIIPIISSAAIATAQLAYLFVSVPSLRARCADSGRPRRGQPADSAWVASVSRSTW